jgi:hypothetical protein
MIGALPKPRNTDVSAQEQSVSVGSWSNGNYTHMPTKSASAASHLGETFDSNCANFFGVSGVVEIYTKE